MTQPTPSNVVQHPANREAVKAEAKRKHEVPAPSIEYTGIGYIGKFPAHGVTIKLGRLKESRDEFTGEIAVFDGTELVEWGRFNLMAATTRAGIAKRITERTEHRVDANWRDLIDTFCRDIVQRERQGEPIVMTDPTAKVGVLDYLLKPMLPAGMPTLLYGSGGTGKSTLAAAIVLSVQTGHSVFPGWSALTAPALVLDWEATREVWQERINAVARGAGMGSVEIAYRRCRRKLIDDTEAIAEAILDHRVGLVVVDAVNQAFGMGNEWQDPADAALRAFGAIREMTGTGVTWLLIDHVSGENMQNDKTTPLKSYGSVSKQWLARQMFYLASEREASEHRQELVLRNTKANYSWKMPPLAMVIERSEDAITFNFHGKVTAPELEAQLTMPQRIKDELIAGAQTVQAVQTALGMAKSKSERDAVHTNLNRMRKRGEVFQLPDGRWGLADETQQGEFA